MKLTCFETVELSDIGKKRKNNEDACLRIPEKGVYCVADGMGGAVGGDLASAAIINRLRKVFVEEPLAEPESFGGHVALFREAADAASRWIKEFADEKVIGQMGSTLVALLFDPNNPRRAVGLHAGDSRLYRYRGGKLQLLTADHTAAAALAAKLGRDASQIPSKFHNELVKAVGLAETVELEKTLVDVAKDDLFLLCSDGLTRMLSEEAITAVLQNTAGAALEQVAQNLIAGANEAGGKDNVTVILIRMGDLGEYSEVFEPVDLDAPQNSAAHAGMEGDPLSLTGLGGGHPQDSSEFMRGHTPQTEDAGAMHGDTPSDSHSSEMRGDTPQTDDAHGPPTPATARPPVPPRAPDQPKASPPVDGKRVVRKGRIIAAALVLLAAAGVFFFLRPGSHSTQSKSGTQPQRAATAPAAVPATKAVLPPPATGGVMVNSQPGGAEVFLQGRKIGLTPFQTNGLPAGQVSLDLMTPTHAGKAVLSIIGGQTTSTNVTLQVRLGAFAIESDPAGAEVWFEGKSLGKTPAHGELPVGQKTLTLKLAGLKDQTAAMLISPTEPSETNVVFAYGAVVINSEPAGAEVRQNEKVLGRTPVTLEGLPPGQYSFQVTANGWQPASLPVEVSDHQTKPVSIKLQKETGLLRLTGNLPGVTASVDGGGAVLLPRDVPVEAGVEHTVTARYKGLEQTIRGLRVNGNQTKVVDEFTFIMEPTRWTNRFSGMVFVKVPGTGLWASANRVTLDQFNKVMAGTPSAAKETEDNGQRYVINLTAGMAKAFATKLNGVNDGAERPAEIKNYHFALPTPGQWMQTFSNAEALGIQITNLRTDREWCLEGNSWHMAGYVLQGTNFYPRPGYKPINPPPGEEPKQLAIRPVLVP